MKPHKTLPWIEPLDILQCIPRDDDSWAFLYSGTASPNNTQRSFLALGPKASVISDNFDNFDHALNEQHNDEFDPWFGYFGYGLKNTLENLPQDTTSTITLPNLWMQQYHFIWIFDHIKKDVILYSDTPDNAPDLIKNTSSHLPSLTIRTIDSNMSKDSYIDNVHAIKHAIAKGDICQANLTRKFYGHLSSTPDPIALFSSLVKISPTPYSALLKCKDHYILSSSPEQFLRIDASGKVQTRPIKGTIKRDASIDDKIARQTLANSEKDRAENLMIVDLSRHDLAHHCTIGSIQVPELFQIDTHATLHHMSSLIEGMKKQTSTNLDVIKSCFPPGSMTGAPKIKAMELCTKYESLARGVYSGAIGWVNGYQETELSVVIRTILIHEDQFEFQVGGAIIADSDAEKEWQETMTKAQALAKCLGIHMDTLEQI